MEGPKTKVGVLKYLFLNSKIYYFSDIEALIQWMARKKHPITKASGCIIKRPIAKEEWVLTHESITTGNKIGQGQFGEVIIFIIKKLF